METYVQAHGFQVWKSVVDGYKELVVPPKNDNRKKLSLNNSKTTNALLNGIYDSVYTIVINCSSTKEIWDKLQNIYEGDSKVKETKLQTYRGSIRTTKDEGRWEHCN